MASPGPVSSKKLAVPPTGQQAGMDGKAKKSGQSPVQITNLARSVIDETKLRKEIDAAISTFGPELRKALGGSNRTVSSRRTEDNAGPERTVTVRDGKGNPIRLEFSPKPESSKQVVGEHRQARDAIALMAKETGRSSEWEKLDKHNITDVKKFLDSMNLTTGDRVKFVNRYLTGFYNHPGKDIIWRGSALQDAIDAVPMDKAGKKYLDCEGFTKLAGHLLGESNLKHYALDAGNSGSRNHQVAVFREGQSAYVINNNQITTADPSKSDERAIQDAYPDYGDIVLDGTGPMVYGTEEYRQGQYLKKPIDNAQVVRILDPKTMIAAVNDSQGTYHFKITVNPKDGRLDRVLHLEPGDQLRDRAGNTLSIGTRNPDGTYQAIRVDRRGIQSPATVTITNRGADWIWRP